MTMSITVIRARWCRRAWRFDIGIAIMCLMLICAFFPGLVAPYDPLAFNYTAIMSPAEPGASLRDR